MLNASTRRHRGTLGSGTLLGLALLFWVAPATRGNPVPPDTWWHKARKAEERGQWGEACRCYDELIRKNRLDDKAREGYARCLRRQQLAARHADATYRQALGKLTPSQALDVYEQVLHILTLAHPDRARTSLPLLFKQGVDEARLALDDPAFRKHHLPGVKDKDIKALQARLAGWGGKAVTSRPEARAHALALLRAAPRDVGPLGPAAMSAVVMELAAGACASLDEHSALLTPGHLAGLDAAGRGKLVGVGVDVGVVREKLQVTRVYPKGPADDGEKGLLERDRILKIAGQPVAGLEAWAAAERLRGEPGTTVEVEVERGADVLKRKLTRRAVVVASVESSRSKALLPDGRAVGYLRITHFQPTTGQEVKAALAEMTTKSPEPIKGLILDLRGNPGGAFRAALAVAELFLAEEAVIVVGQSPFPEYNKVFKSEAAAASRLAVVVLIDGETASAAEVLAGALKESRRAPTRLLGQTTYGKGSIQCLIPLEKTALPLGVRLTVARLLSPSNQGYTHRGVTPDEESELDGDELVDEAVKKLYELLSPMREMSPGGERV